MEEKIELNAPKFKHSKLSITSFIIFLSSLIPVFLWILAINGINVFYLIGLKLSLNQAGIVADILTYWVIVALVSSLVLSIVDLKRPNRLKLLPKITIIIICILFALSLVLGILIAVNDINRMIS